MNVLFSILLNSIVPIFILISLGYIIGKKFDMDIGTLTKVNFYLFVPSFAFINIYNTNITPGLIKIILIGLVLLLVNFLIGAGTGRLLGLPTKSVKAFENSLMFNNSANIGIPLITLVFSNAPFVVDGQTPYLEAAISIQVMVMLVQNLTVNTLGFVNSGGEGMNAKAGLRKILRMPAIYVIPSAILLRLTPFDITATPLWPALEYLRAGLVAMALTILGIQLSQTKLNLKRKVPYLSVILRLIGGPVIALAVIHIFRLTGVAAQAVFISASTPTAVNVALLSVECKGDIEFAVQSVTLSTLFSAVTMTAAIYLSNVIF